MREDLAVWLAGLANRWVSFSSNTESSVSFSFNGVGCYRVSRGDVEIITTTDLEAALVVLNEIAPDDYIWGTEALWEQLKKM